jgi:hypothetical protein
MVRSPRPLRGLLAANMALQRTRALAFARVRSLPSVARRSPLNAQPLGVPSSRQQPLGISGLPRFSTLATRSPSGGERRLMFHRWLRVAASSSLPVPVASVAGNLRSA